MNERVNKILKPYQSTFHLIDKISKISKINQPFEMGKQISDFNSKIGLLEMSAISSAGKAIAASQKFNNIAYSKANWENISNKKVNFAFTNSIYEKIAILDKNFQAFNNIEHIFPKERSFKTIIENSVGIDIENHKTEQANIEAAIEEILDEANKLIGSINDSSEYAFTIINNFLNKVFSSRNIRTLTRAFIMDLVINILVTIATQSINNANSDITNQEVVINNTTNNITIVNTCPTSINSLEKTLYTYPRSTSKIIDSIPIATEITIIKHNRIWNLISYKNEEDRYIIGWTTSERLD